MNKLDELNFVDLSDKEVEELRKYEGQINQVHKDEEIYLMALKK